MSDIIRIYIRLRKIAYLIILCSSFICLFDRHRVHLFMLHRSTISMILDNKMVDQRKMESREVK